MKQKTILPALLASVALFAAFAYNTYAPLAIGAQAPKADVKMKGISGKELSLNDIKKENGLLVIFSCNTCPFVIAWENRYPEIGALCKKNNIGMVLLNSNEAKRTGADSYSKMKQHATNKGYGFHYVVDRNSVLANAFGAKTTPHVFLFNKELKLMYRGAIDDNYKDAASVTKHYLKNALAGLLAGKPASPSQTKAIGCSIKRVKAGN